MKFGTRFAMPRRVAKLDKLGDGSFCATFESGSASAAAPSLSPPGSNIGVCQSTVLANSRAKGPYYAATEIEARYCKNTQAVIIGGGNSAGQAAMYLSRSAKMRAPDRARPITRRLDVELPVEPAHGRSRNHYRLQTRRSSHCTAAAISQRLRSAIRARGHGTISKRAPCSSWSVRPPILAGCRDWCSWTPRVLFARAPIAARSRPLQHRSPASSLLAISAPARSNASPRRSAKVRSSCRRSGNI